jgi:hypothetical protein
LWGANVLQDYTIEHEDTEGLRCRFSEDEAIEMDWEE